ncbi:enoyl-CoA hydratase/carnithine racemase [Pterulicium gracile]|uniref:Enoyl-CoA hydratase/carnithine racemase n=1 Tax=Pterulicium gracile TaxID=1884261 RepID=A0A5C3R2T0_9AGAR|nr:enoyl-CoA hydratase/carnithine racemase [Pterula gracilis]
MSGLAPPRTTQQLLVSFPLPHALQLTINRPKARNAVAQDLEDEIGRVMDWFEEEEDLWVCIITGAGDIFCSGTDLLAWGARKAGGEVSESQSVLGWTNGFASLSMRQSRKPWIAAVNGAAFGGGAEIVLNCDLVVASEDAVFGLPEVRLGVMAFGGGIPRLSRVAGHQLASEMLLTGATISAQDAYSRFHFVNKVVPKDQVLPAAFKLAKSIIASSPDSVQSTKHALLCAQRNGSVTEAFTEHAQSAISDRVFRGSNMKEGLQAFAEKRKPRWTQPAKL